VSLECRATLGAQRLAVDWVNLRKAPDATCHGFALPMTPTSHTRELGTLVRVGLRRYRDPMRGWPVRVYVSGAGQAYHASAVCRLLRAGQEKARERGHVVRAPSVRGAGRDEGPTATMRGMPSPADAHHEPPRFALATYDALITK
jgi:hypothetical protein